MTDRQIGDIWDEGGKRWIISPDGEKRELIDTVEKLLDLLVSQNLPNPPELTRLQFNVPLEAHPRWLETKDIKKTNEHGEEFVETITITKSSLYFSYCYFVKNVNLSSLFFKESCGFQSCIFEDNLEFVGSQFLKLFNLSGSKFLNKNARIDFTESKFFSPNNQFNHCEFQGNFILTDGLSGGIKFLGSFFKNAAFSRYEFQNESDFTQSTFEKVFFENCNFISCADFEDCEFQEEATFSNTQFQSVCRFPISRFKAPTLFKSLTFGGYVNFLGATIESDLTFLNLKFKSNSLEEVKVVFEEIKFIKDAYIKLNGDLNEEIKLDPENKVKRGLIIFENISTAYEKPFINISNIKKRKDVELHLSFLNCFFQEKNVFLSKCTMSLVFIAEGTWFYGMKFIHCKWQRLCLEKDLFLRGLRFHGFNLRLGQYNELSSMYANLKTMSQSLGETQIANGFYFWQQYYQYRANMLGKAAQAWSWLYLVTSAYGLCILRPVCWWLVCLILAATCFSVFIYGHATDIGYALQHPLKIFGPDVHLDRGAWLQSLRFSFLPLVAALDPKSENINLLWLGVIALPLFIVQSYLLFQIGAAIRNKVKR